MTAIQGEGQEEIIASATRRSLDMRAWSVLEWGLRVVTLAMAAAVLAHEWRLINIESNRFTDQDGHQLEAKILEKLPPQWLREDIRDIKSSLKSFDERLRRIEIK